MSNHCKDKPPFFVQCYSVCFKWIFHSVINCSPLHIVDSLSTEFCLCIHTKKAISFLCYVSHTYFLSCFQYYIAFDSLLLRAARSDKRFQLYCYFSVFYYRYINIYTVLTQILNDNLTGKTKYKYNTNCFKQRRLSCLISKYNTCKSPPFFSDF